MQHNQNNNKRYSVSIVNLIGNTEHRHFLELQSEFGIQQRGGSFLPFTPRAHTKRLVHDLNLLVKSERLDFINSTNFITNLS